MLLRDFVAVVPPNTEIYVVSSREKSKFVYVYALTAKEMASTVLSVKIDYVFVGKGVKHFFEVHIV